eukprot:10675837-Karenia_brevis.AAC.1
MAEPSRAEKNTWPQDDLHKLDIHEVETICSKNVERNCALSSGDICRQPVDILAFVILGFASFHRQTN